MLDEGCVYDAPIVLKTSGAVLDCRGALIDLRRRHRFGIEIGVEAGVRDVTVRNCRIANAANSGVVVGWQSPASVREKKYTEEERYVAATQRVTLDNVTSTDNDIAGIYVLAYSQDVRITGSRLSRNAGVGVYIGPQSMRTTVEDSELSANGLGSPRHERRGLGRREGVAIDASSDNVIRRNTFRGNGGAVYLYKNCQEMVSGHGRNFKRTKPSERNRIEDNKIQGSLIGVWAASRQSRILASSDCGDPYYGEGNYVLDRAPGNIIARNTFTDVGVAAVIEDDRNRFVDNIISGAANSCAVVGTGPRSEKLGRPVVDVVVARNRCQSAQDLDVSWRPYSRTGANMRGYSPGRFQSVFRDIRVVPAGAGALRGSRPPSRPVTRLFGKTDRTSAVFIVCSRRRPSVACSGTGASDDGGVDQGDPASRGHAARVRRPGSCGRLRPPLVLIRLGHSSGALAA
ncbi:right-handed parallel beta-helix repeat-containing protein [Hansschlegelia beijingensis]